MDYGNSALEVGPVAGLEPYRTWGQVAGYFDGDGSVYLNTASSQVLQFGLVWVDNCKRQLDQLRYFLTSRGIQVGRVTQDRQGVFRLHVASPKNVLKAAKLLLPHCSKKRFELSLVVNYYENRVNGTQTLEGFNQAVMIGLRVGKIRPLQLRQKYIDAKKEIAKQRGLRSKMFRKTRTPGKI